MTKIRFAPDPDAKVWEKVVVPPDWPMAHIKPSLFEVLGEGKIEVQYDPSLYQTVCDLMPIEFEVWQLVYKLSPRGGIYKKLGTFPVSRLKAEENGDVVALFEPEVRP